MVCTTILFLRVRKDHQSSFHFVHLNNEWKGFSPVFYESNVKTPVTIVRI